MNLDSLELRVAGLVHVGLILLSDIVGAARDTVGSYVIVASAVGGLLGLLIGRSSAHLDLISFVGVAALLGSLLGIAVEVGRLYSRLWAALAYARPSHERALMLVAAGGVLVVPVVGLAGYPVGLRGDAAIIAAYVVFLVMVLTALMIALVVRRRSGADSGPAATRASRRRHRSA